MNRQQKRMKKQKQRKNRGLGRHFCSGAEIGTRVALTRENAIERATNSQLQIGMWMVAVALHDSFGFGPERIKKVLDATNNVQDWMNKLANDSIDMLTGKPDFEYAREKLRMRAEEVSGTKIVYYGDVV